MADIEDQILQHSHAFEGLLSLIPVTEKRVLTKQERKEEEKKAKKAKLEQKLAARGEQIDNRESKKEAVYQKKPKEPKPKQIPEDKSSEVPLVESTSTENSANPKQKKKRQQKETATAKNELSNDAAKTEPRKKERSGSGKKELAKKAAEKETSVKNVSTKKETTKEETANKMGPIKKKSAEQEGGREGVPTETSIKISLDPSEITMAPSGSIEAHTEDTNAPPQPTELISLTARAEARARLAAHIESLRTRRNPKSTARAALLEAREKKAQARKERKKTSRLAQKLESTSLDSPDLPTSPQTRPPAMTPKEMEKAENNFTFGAVTFDDGQELDHTMSDFKKSRKRKGPTDVMGQLKQVEAKKARLETMDPEKREKIYEKETWSKALKQTVGEKVRDDEKLLKKALKRQTVQKKKSEREWKERKDSVAKGIAVRQKKREENINARKEQKKLGKAGMKKKAKMAQKAGGKKKPPPQHSKNKGGKKSGDKSKSGGKPAGKTGGGKKFSK